MLKAIGIKFIAPIVYLILWLLPRNSGFIDHHKLLIAEYGQVLIFIQIITCAIGCWIYKSRLLQLILTFLMIFFWVILFNSIGSFNPF